jgi:hypothetical protein
LTYCASETKIFAVTLTNYASKSSIKTAATTAAATAIVTRSVHIRTETTKGGATIHVS